MSEVAHKDAPGSHGVEESLPHTEAISVVRKELADIIQGDPLLCDLPAEITLDEIQSQIALEYGQAMVVNVRRADNQVMGIVVTQNATVLDLKHAIKRHFVLQQNRAKGPTKLSWKYVWKRHWLYFDGQHLTDDNKRIKDYGIHNKDEVTFMKRLQER